MYQHAQQLGIVIALFIVAGAAERVHAGPSDNAPGPSSVNDQDLLYDFELWIAWDVLRYDVIAKFSDGHTEQYKFYSEQGAQDFIAWLAFHIHNFAGAHIVEHLEMGPWTHYATYDTKAEAQGVAALAISLDFYAAVVPVSAIQMRQYR